MTGGENLEIERMEKSMPVDQVAAEGHRSKGLLNARVNRRCFSAT